MYEVEETWTLQLGYVEVKKYVWVSVNAAGVEDIVKAFIGMVYDLLLSKRWMHRVRASSIYPGRQSRYLLQSCTDRNQRFERATRVAGLRHSKILAGRLLFPRTKALSLKFQPQCPRFSYSSYANPFLL